MQDALSAARESSLLEALQNAAKGMATMCDLFQQAVDATKATQTFVKDTTCAHYRGGVYEANFGHCVADLSYAMPAYVEIQINSVGSNSQIAHIYKVFLMRQVHLQSIWSRNDVIWKYPPA